MTSMELAATHLAFLLNRHYVVYVNAQCPYHGSQTWSFEKYLDPGSDFKYNQDQTYEKGTIYVSCSHFLDKLKTKRVHYFANQGITVAQGVSQLSSRSFYETFFFNCKNFGRVTFRDFEKLDGGRDQFYLGYGSWGRTH